MIIVDILVFLVSLSAVIILHELGHFVMARRAGILCHEFSLGMGPVLWKTKKGETVYTIRAIPIGGYVMMAGEEVEDEIVKPGTQVRLEFEGNTVNKIVLDHQDDRFEHLLKVTVDKVDLKGKGMTPLYINDYPVKRDAFYVHKNRELQIAPYERGFEGKTKMQRFWAMFAGPLMNFVLAYFVFLGINLIVGFPDMETPIIGSVGDGLPAYEELIENDRIISVNGVAVETWNELSIELDNSYSDRDLELVVIRDGVEVPVVLEPILYFYGVGFHSAENSGEVPILGSIDENSLAGTSGFKINDQLVKINNQPVQTWDEVITELTTVGQRDYVDGYDLEFTVLRDGNEIELSIEQPYTEAFLASQNLKLIDSKIGISPVFEFDFGKSIVGGFTSVGNSAQIIFTTLGLLFDDSGAGAGIGVGNLAGPLGIFEITSQARSQGVISLMSWIGLLSVNLGVINLLPIPALDGGRLVFLGYEAIVGRKPNKKIENTLHYVMYLALMGLFVFITFNDVLRLFNIK